MERGLYHSNRADGSLRLCVPLIGWGVQSRGMAGTVLDSRHPGIQS